MTEFIFRPPTVLEGPIGAARLFEFYKLDRGITVVRDTDGEYSQIRYPEDEILQDFPEVYRGGYEYIVSAATKAALIAGNVGVTEDNFEPA
jgi:hypothetical protein